MVRCCYIYCLCVVVKLDVTLEQQHTCERCKQVKSYELKTYKVNGTWKKLCIACINWVRRHKQ